MKGQNSKPGICSSTLIWSDSNEGQNVITNKVKYVTGRGSLEETRRNMTVGGTVKISKPSYLDIEVKDLRQYTTILY